MNVNLDEEVESGMGSLSTAADQDKIAAIQTGDKIGATMGDHMPVKEWMSNLPKNVTVGVMDAARNTVDAVNGFGAMLDNNLKEKDRRAREDGVDSGGPPQASAQELRMAALERGSATDVTDPNPYSDHTGFRAHYQAFRDQLATGSGTSDEITQSISQFAIPMLGWTKLLGVQKAISLAGFGAEALTASTALAPHGGRNADLIAQGKTIEGKLGQALNAISPEGTALNAYINYMTDRNGETEAEGRFKNVIDSLVTTASGAALLKTGAVALKAGQELPRYIAENAGVPRVGPGAQEGKIVFHGTPHSFDEFSNDKIGTGEGSQAYGHGLYFAEDPNVASTYSSRRSDGNLYHVDVPDEHIAGMLDYDAPLADQPESVQNVLKQHSIDDNDPRLKTGGDAYYKLAKQLASPDTNGEIAASRKLNDAGVSGIKFLDQFSREPRLHDKTGALFPIKGYAAEQAMFLVKQQGSVDKALRAAERRGWNSGFYQDKEKYDALKEFAARGLELKQQGTRNIVLFDAKHAKIIKKE